MNVTPTDRGYVYIERVGAVSNVYVSMGRDEAGEPIDIYARHFKRRNIEIDPKVHFLPVGKMLGTTGPASVVADNTGRVFIRSPR